MLVILNTIRKTFGDIFRYFYPGFLFLTLWTAREARDLGEFGVLTIKNEQVVPYAILTGVSGVIIYFFCRAVVFDMVLVRFRNRLWNWGHAEIGVDTMIARFSKKTGRKLADYLGTRFGAVNAQAQTTLLFVLAPLFAAEESIWRSRWYLALLLICVPLLSWSVYVQCCTLWRIEKKISEMP